MKKGIALVAAPASGLGQLLFFCTMTGEVGSQCCCQHEVERDVREVSTLRAAPCCEVVSTEQPALLSWVEVPAPQLKTPPFITLSFAPSERTRVRAPTRLALPYDSRGPPPDAGPPIFIKHCSYLL